MRRDGSGRVGQRGPEGPVEEPHDLRLLPLAAGVWLAQAVVLLIGPGNPVGTLLAGAGLIASALAVSAFGMLARSRTARIGRTGPPARRRARARSRHVRIGRTGTPARGRPRSRHVRIARTGPRARGRSGSQALGAIWRRARRLARRDVLAPGLLLAVGLGLGASVGSLHLARLHHPVLDGLAEESAVVVAQLTVTGDPVARVPGDDGGRPMPVRWSAEARLERVVARGRSLRTSVPVLLTGAAVERLRYGSGVRLAARAARAWNPQRHAMVLRLVGPVAERAPPGRVASITTGIRASFRAATSGLPADAGALLLGLAVGDESRVSHQLDEAMIRSGLAHLTAVSGSNTSLVAGLALAGAAGLGLGRRTRVASSLVVLTGYVALVRPQPSVLRAAAMGFVALLALTAGGRRRGAPALLASVVVLLIVVPGFAVSLGFALSVAATGGLLVVGPALAVRLARWAATRWIPEPIRAALAVSAAAHVATLPLAVLMGNGASLVALPANVLVTPLVPVATVLGLAAALVASISTTVGAGLAHVASPATWLIAWVAHRAAGLPGGVVAVPDGALAGTAAAVGIAVLLLAAHRGWRLPRTWALVALLGGTAAVLVGRWVADARWPPPGWLVLVCDVGQGDALLVRAPGVRDALLVDVGPPDAGVVQCARDAGVRPVAVMLSHFHDDHVGDLAGVLGAWQVPLLTSPIALPEPGAREVIAAAGASGAGLRSLRAGDRISVAGVDLSVLWPARSIAASPANNGSLVVLADVPTGNGSLRLLLTGDIEPEAQQAVMAQPGPRADVVKVPHHGSPFQAPGFVRWAGGRIALVSVGARNDYGHPSAATLSGYRAAGAQVGRTDEDGALAVVPGDGGPTLVVQR